MKLALLSLLLNLCSYLASSAELRFESTGYSKSKVYNISKDRIYLSFTCNAIFSTNIGIVGDSECQGILEIINGVTSSNIMCKGIEKNGDIHFSQFKASSSSDIQTQGTQTFTFVSGEGRWAELVGQKCIGATSSINPKDLGEGVYQDAFMWAGKCEVPDATLERVKNYKKP